jgi:predicted nucleic acid-binding protein
MVKPLREGRKNEALDYAFTIENFPNLTVKAPDVAIAIKAAELHAVYGIKTPDALHLATAITSGAEVFVSQDVGLKRVKEIAVYPLRDTLTQFKDDAGA